MSALQRAVQSVKETLAELESVQTKIEVPSEEYGIQKAADDLRAELKNFDIRFELSFLEHREPNPTLRWSIWDGAVYHRASTLKQAATKALADREKPVSSEIDSVKTAQAAIDAVAGPRSFDDEHLDNRLAQLRSEQQPQQ